MRCISTIRDPHLHYDSIRFYQLGKEWKQRIEHYGAKPGIDIDGALII